MPTGSKKRNRKHSAEADPPTWVAAVSRLGRLLVCCLCLVSCIAPASFLFHVVLEVITVFSNRAENKTACDILPTTPT